MPEELMPCGISQERVTPPSLTVDILSRRVTSSSLSYLHFHFRVFTSASTSCSPSPSLPPPHPPPYPPLSHGQQHTKRAARLRLLPALQHAATGVEHQHSRQRRPRLSPSSQSAANHTSTLLMLVPLAPYTTDLTMPSMYSTSSWSPNTILPLHNPASSPRSSPK